MKIPRHISEYLIKNPPERFSWTTKHDETFDSFLVEDKYFFHDRKEQSSSTPKQKFNSSMDRVLEYVDAVKSVYIQNVWYKQLKEICEDT